MKRKTIAITFVVFMTGMASANAWSEDGMWIQDTRKTAHCAPEPYTCIESVDPTDPSPSVGDQVKFYPNGGNPRGGVIVEINSDGGGSSSSPSTISPTAPDETFGEFINLN